MSRHTTSTSPSTPCSGSPSLVMKDTAPPPSPPPPPQDNTRPR
ncbi:hypothetical protein E2C01_024228 [Portunus trituberculatus]|uniref:Uncharacterized protein n=1 Tax=Portunus trituberculatus TaxID=210409 RepID=A0A5B7ECL1_PORTR|nr:hypothetical protein [Portunus trituberculatus]